MVWLRQFFFLIYFDLIKMSRLKRVYIALTILLFFIGMIGVAILQKKDKIGGRGHLGEMLRELMNATTFSQILLVPSIFLILPVLVGIFSASSFAGEDHLGLIRTVAIRPLSRVSIIFARIISMSVFAYFLLFVMMLVSYLLGGIMFGFDGQVFCLGFKEVGQKAFYVLSEGEGLMTLLRSYFFSGFALVSIICLFMMFAIIMRKQGNAIVSALGVYFVSFILMSMPMMENIRPYLPAKYMMLWRFSLGREIMWGPFLHDLMILGGFTSCFVLLGIIVFQRRAL